MRTGNGDSPNRAALCEAANELRGSVDSAVRGYATEPEARAAQQDCSLPDTAPTSEPR